MRNGAFVAVALLAISNILTGIGALGNNYRIDRLEAICGTD